MKMVKSKLALSAAVAALALSATAANAAVSITSAVGDAAYGADEQLVMDFDNPAAAGYSIVPDGTTTTGITSGQYAAPANDDTKYYYVQGGDEATFTSNLLMKSLSLYIGSLDSYNFITFYRGADVVGTFDGENYAPANGSWTSDDTNRRFYFDFGSDRVDRVVFSSESNSFEFDNIAVSAVPEPGVWALMISGFGMLGAALRRRRTTAATFA